MKRINMLLICACLGILLLATGCSNTAADVTLGQYTDLNLEYTKKTVTEKDIDNRIIDDVTADQENVTITNRGVRNGDVANINYLGKVDGVAFDGGTAEEQDLTIGSGSFIPGFEDQVIGMKKGQTKDIKVTFPDPYQNNPDLAGAEAVFTVKVNSIQGKIVPSKITNTMIKKISDTYSTVKDYREYIRGVLELAFEENNEQSKQTAVWNSIVESTTVKNFSTKQIRYYSGLFEKNYQYYADMYQVDLTTLIESYMGITVEEYNSDKKAYAEERVTSLAISEEIANEHNISFTDAEYEEYITENEVSDEDKNDFGDSIKANLLQKKVLEFLVTKNNFTEKK